MAYRVSTFFRDVAEPETNEFFRTSSQAHNGKFRQKLLCSQPAAHSPGGQTPGSRSYTSAASQGTIPPPAALATRESGKWSFWLCRLGSIWAHKTGVGVGGEWATCSVCSAVFYLPRPCYLLYFVAVPPKHTTIRMQIAERLSWADFLKPVRKCTDFFPCSQWIVCLKIRIFDSIL